MAISPRLWRVMYDREAAAWERRRDEPEHQELVEQAVAQFAQVVEPPGPVVDLGCGPGAHVRALAERGYDVVGVDGSPRMVEVAQARAERDGVAARFEVHDVSDRLPYDDASLSGVLSVLVVQHLPDPPAFLAEIRRCLRPGGHLLITAPALDGEACAAPTRYWRVRSFLAQRTPGLVRFFDTDSLRELVKGAGLTVVECAAASRRVTAIARS